MSAQLIHKAGNMFAPWVIEEIDPAFLERMDYTDAMDLCDDAQWCLFG